VNSDSERYAPDHLARVALDIFMPGCEMAGYNAARANQIRDANLIHLDILQKLVDARLIAAVVVKPGHARSRPPTSFDITPSRIPDGAGIPGGEPENRLARCNAGCSAGV
jgi:hypothetical protein